jgi:SAM-dependent methyltransferase
VRSLAVQIRLNQTTLQVRPEEYFVSGEASPKADSMGVFQGVGFRFFLLLMAANATVCWLVVGPSNPWCAFSVAWGTASLVPAIPTVPLLRRVPRQWFRVPRGERVLHRMLGVGVCGWLLDVSGWNRRVVEPLRGFSGTKSGLAWFEQSVRSSIVSHGICFAIHALLAVLALFARHPLRGVLWMLLPGVVLHLYPVLIQRSLMLRLQPLLDKGGAYGLGEVHMPAIKTGSTSTQETQCKKPTGLVGRLTLWRMNKSHSKLTDWGLMHTIVESRFTVLDVGCGGGRTISKLAAIAEQGKVHGIDYAKESVAASRRYNAGAIRAGRVEIHLAEVGKLPFPDNTYDLVTGVETHFWWPDIDAGLLEIRRVLKPGGTLILIAEVYKGADAFTSRMCERSAALTGMKMLTRDEHRDLLNSAGFADVQIDALGAKGWIAAQGRKPKRMPLLNEE